MEDLNEQLDPTIQDEQQTKSQWFDKFAIRDLSGQQKGEIASTIIDDINTGIEYRSQMILSAVVASLGLLINATPVVIGAMLIAPIMRPIQAVSFATTTGNRYLFVRSIWVLLISIGIGVGCAFLVTFLIPFAQETNEIIARTQPTLVDLGIAFASGLVAFLAFGRKKMAASLAGVAMAASLVPPMCVIGIGIAFFSIDIARGSTILFLTNIVAIIVAGIGVFYLFGFHPTQKDDLKRSLFNTVSALIMMFLLCIPLASSVVSITRHLRTTDTISRTTNAFMREIDQSIDIEHLDYERISGGKSISLTLRVPQEKLSSITDENKSLLTTQLAEKLKENVELDVTLIPVTTVYQEQVREPTLQDNITTVTQNFLQTLYPDAAYLLDLEIHEQERRIVVATFYADQVFDKTAFKQQYEAYIKDTQFSVQTVIINWQSDGSDQIPLTVNQQRSQSLNNHFRGFFPESLLHKLTLETFDDRMNIELYVSTPLSSAEFADKLTRWEDELGEIYEERSIVKARTSDLTEIE